MTSTAQYELLHQGIKKRRRSISRRDVQFHRSVVETALIHCNCNLCSPHYYGNENCRQNHQVVRVNVIPRCKPNLQTLHFGVYEALQLADAAIQYFTRSEGAMHVTQKIAIDDLRTLLQRRDFVQRMNALDASQTVSGGEMQVILAFVNTIFFFGAVRPVGFRWERSMSTYGLTQSFPAYPYGSWYLIQIHSTRLAEWRGITQMNLRIGVALHELTHCFLSQHVCQTCRSYVYSCNAYHHGRAFQRIAKALEDAFAKLFGLELYLAAWEGLRTDLLQGAWRPSRCDLNSWGLS